MVDALAQAALAGQRRALARLISLLEDAPERAAELLAPLYAHTGRAHIVGFTGSPGAGKSTLVAQVAAEYRRRGATVGIVAVDPTSPFSGGAVLGDRIRMRALSGDPGVFIRSMATRGELGGLARATADVTAALDACGYEHILVETVGAGQSEVEIVRAAHTTVVIQVPEQGDDVQTLKAGLLEAADILVVNKADLDGAQRTAILLEAMLDLRAAQTRGAESGWRPPVLATVATAGEGIAPLAEAIARHHGYLSASGQRSAVELRRARARVVEIARAALWERALATLGDAALDAVAERVTARETDPYAAAQELLASLSFRAVHGEESRHGLSRGPSGRRRPSG
ncbi:MAG: methylmalonyl Co-A mutase-associated GTPase MeaB [Chloroflexota bacterium]